MENLFGSMHILMPTLLLPPLPRTLMVCHLHTLQVKSHSTNTGNVWILKKTCATLVLDPLRKKRSNLLKKNKFSFSNQKIAILKTSIKFINRFTNISTTLQSQNTGSLSTSMVLTETNSNQQELLKETASNLILLTSFLRDSLQDQLVWTLLKLTLNSQRDKLEEMTNKLSENCLSSSATQLTPQPWKTKASSAMSNHIPETKESDHR